MADYTPMKRQYNEIKSNYEDCLLFFRLGDFYEMFDHDAETASKELDLTLTTRDRGKPVEEQTPMCGVPYHSAEAYIARLIQKGYKVAICEQTEDPSLSKGLVSRDVIRVITPGTVIDSSMLDEGKSNYIAAVYMDEGFCSAAFCDISTGEFCVASFAEDAVRHVINELGRFSPKEAVLSPAASACPDITDFLGKRIDCPWEKRESCFDTIEGAKLVCAQFNVDRLDSLGNGTNSAAFSAAGGLLSYLNETQKRDLSHINTLDIFSDRRYMELDYVTKRNLELTENLNTGEKRGSLLWVLDKTKTPMGSRELRSWLERPLLSPLAINRRLTAVGELAADNVRRGELMETLKEIGDMARLISRVVYGNANPRDMLALCIYCEQIPRLVSLLHGSESAMLQEIEKTDPLEDVAGSIRRAVCDEPPISVRDGKILRPGYSEEVDRLRGIAEHGSDMIRDIEQRERERTGIKKLKVGYNRVFGYYIDVPRSAGDAPLPDDYIRKQTLISNERYFTQELKDLETQLLTAEDTLKDMEFQFFEDLRRLVAKEVARVQHAAGEVARLDALCSLAEVAVRNNFVRPEVDMTRVLDIREARHPVVEQMQKDSLFVPNDTFLNDGQDRVAIITGPNMAGKSTYMRQTALIVLLAQTGSFVPAKSARIGVCDRVFTRIGASDNLAAGQSTFMVEMTEVAAILRQATQASLLILDEIGRGTSTYDGMAIARAVLEYCADKRRLGAKTMFATHYHELSVLEGELDGVRNYNITAKKKGGELIFLRKVVPGAADDSYGIEVAKLAGVPDSVIAKAKEHLRKLEEGGAPGGFTPRAESNAEQLSLTDMGGEQALEKLRAVSIDTITPIEAMNILYELKRSLDGVN